MLTMHTPIPEIIRFPQAILANCARERLDELLRNEVLLARESGQPIAQPLLRRIAWHPELAARLICAQVFSQREIDVLLAEPAAACSILLENYAGLCTRIEPRILGHLPSVERLLVDQRSTGREALRAQSEYLRLLARDADRRYRLTSVIERPIVLASLTEESEMCREESPSMAFFYFTTHPRSEITPRLAGVLNDDEEYQYLALRVARGRRRQEAEIRLLAEFREPAWAFHVLRDRLLPEKDRELQEIVQSHPAWLAEWWQLARLDRAQLAASYEASADCCANHELLPELYWFYRTFSARLAVPNEAA